MKDATENRKPEEEQRWEHGWEEHETLQRHRISRLPLSEKLRWLEEAHHMVRSLQTNRSPAACPENSSKD